MKTTPFSKIWRGATYRAGMTPEMLAPVDKDRLVTFLQDRLKAGWEWGEWPEWTAVEERTTVPEWSSTVVYAIDAVVWNPGDGRYYKSLVLSNVGNDPDGTPSAWELTDPPAAGSEMGTVFGVYATSPLLTRAKPIPFVVAEGGVMPREPLSKFFVTFRRPVPVITLTAWVVDEAYLVGDVRYDEATGDCWVATADNVGMPPLANPDKWARILIPECLGEWLRLGAAADLLRMAGNARSADAADGRAQSSLSRAYDAAVQQQGQQTRVQFRGR